MSDPQYISVGAEWCGYSKKQETELANAADKLGDNVSMIMCQGKDESLSAEEKAICEKALPQLTGVPTWFKKEGDSVAPITKEVTQQQGLHFLQESQLCEALPGACTQ